MKKYEILFVVILSLVLSLATFVVAFYLGDTMYHSPFITAIRQYNFP